MCGMASLCHQQTGSVLEDAGYVDVYEAGYVDVYEVTYLGLRGSYSATEEGRRRLEES